MNTRHSRRISRNAAELMLDGHAGPDPGQLTRVLAAATAPARDGELAGEQMAVAAFEASHLVPVATPHREHKSMLAKLLTAKILATSLAAFATGGVALAAGTGALTGSGSAHVSASASQPASPPTASASTLPSASASPRPTTSAGIQPRGPVGIQPTQSTRADPASAASPTASTLPQGAAALCRALAGDVASVAGNTLSPSGLERALGSAKLPQVLSSPEFASLVATAQSAASVSDYCALVLDLPQLPQPSDLAQLPSTLLGQLLTTLPTSTLAQVLTSLPSSTLAQVLTAVPTSALSSILTGLPPAVVSKLLAELPTSALAQLPASVLSQLPTSVLSQLPTSILSGLGL
jgi:hypothetical protein